MGRFFYAYLGIDALREMHITFTHSRTFFFFFTMQNVSASYLQRRPFFLLGHPVREEEKDEKAG